MLIAAPVWNQNYNLDPNLDGGFRYSVRAHPNQAWANRPSKLGLRKANKICKKSTSIFTSIFKVGLNKAVKKCKKNWKTLIRMEFWPWPSDFRIFSTSFTLWDADCGPGVNTKFWMTIFDFQSASILIRVDIHLLKKRALKSKISRTFFTFSVAFYFSKNKTGIHHPFYYVFLFKSIWT